MLVVVDDQKRVRSVMRRGTLVPPLLKPGWRVLDTDHHTCPNHTGKASIKMEASPLSSMDPSGPVLTLAEAGMPRCEGCVAESYILEWLFDRVSGLEAFQAEAEMVADVRAQRAAEGR